MSNIIQIKRGIAAPEENNLAPYELGYVVNRYVKTEAGKADTVEEVADGGYLYIGDLNKDNSSKTTPVKIKAGYADEAGIANGLSAEAKAELNSIRVADAEKADLAESSKVLTVNNAKKAGWNGLQYFNMQDAIGPTSDTNSDSDAPADGNWHIIRCNYRSNESGKEDTMCRTDLAIPVTYDRDFQSGSLYFKRVSKGFIANQGGNNLGWIKILDVENFRAYAEKNKILTGNNFFKFADAQGALTTANFKNKISSLKPALLDAIYPVGSIYMSVDSKSPATLFGGTWVQLQDRFLIGASNTFPAGEQKGSRSVTLTKDNLPSHDHGTWQRADATGDTSGYNSMVDNYGTGDTVKGWAPSLSQASKKEMRTTTEGSGTSFDILPPYLAVYMWKRTK